MFRTFEMSDPALAPEGLRFVTVKSAALRQRADLLVFVPRQVRVLEEGLEGAAGLRDVPIAILLHGVYGSHWAWAFTGFAENDDLIAAESAARRGRRGLWADPQPQPPRQWRELHPPHAGPGWR